MLIDKSQPNDNSLSSICALGAGQCISSGNLLNIVKDDLDKIINLDEHVESKEKINRLAEELKCSGDTNDKQLCIMQKLDKKKELVKYFKPVTKSFSHTHWLNNTEIDTVQYQFMNSYPGYYYSNIHMIDFGMFHPATHNHIDYDPPALKDINFPSELKGKSNIFNSNDKLKYYGVVVNTDISSGGGIHWFAIFMDFTKTPITIEYFNSSGYDIKNKQFKRFFIDLANDISTELRPCEFVKVSDIQHQKSSTSNCGVYALYYIWKRLGGESIEFFRQNKIEDDHIVLFRKYFFRSQV